MALQTGQSVRIIVDVHISGVSARRGSIVYVSEELPTVFLSLSLRGFKPPESPAGHMYPCYPDQS